MTRCAIYTRVSDPSSGQTTENQLPMLEKHASSRGWKVVRVYEDRQSAYQPKKRPEFERLIADATTHKKPPFDTILFWSLDRFSRRGVRDTVELLGRLDDAGVGFCSLTEQYLDSAGVFKDAIIAILACLARQESIRQSERVKAGMARCSARGMKFGRKPADIDMAELDRLREKNLSMAQIGRMMGVSRDTLYRRLEERERVQELQGDLGK